MVATIERRLGRLEESFGDSPCERCKNTVIVIDTSGAIIVHKGSTSLAPEAAERFYKEEQPHGVCPACGGYRERIRVTWGPGSSYYARQPGL